MRAGRRELLAPRGSFKHVMLMAMMLTAVSAMLITFVSAELGLKKSVNDYVEQEFDRWQLYLQEQFTRLPARYEDEWVDSAELAATPQRALWKVLRSSRAEWLSLWWSDGRRAEASGSQGFSRQFSEAVAQRGQAPGTWLFVRQGRLYQGVLLAVQHDEQTGWLAAVHDLGASLTDTFPAMSGMDASVLQRRGEHWHVLFSSQTLAEPASAERADTAKRLLPWVSALNPDIQLLLHQRTRAAEDALAAVRERILFAGLGALLVTLFASIALARRIARPVEALSAAAARISAGDYRQPIVVNNRDELGVLASLINGMQSSIALREQTIRQQLFHDPLTGLTNRRGLQDLAAQPGFLQRISRGCTFILVDLQQFSRINDLFGYDQGDRTLISCVDRLRAALPGGIEQSDERAGDCGPILARLDGARFLLMCETPEKPELKALLARIRSSLQQPHLGLPEGFVINCRIGSANSPADGLEPDELVRRANLALHKAKRSQQAVAYYQPGQEDANHRRLQITGDIPRAIREGELRLCFQPIVDLHDDRLDHVEALIRWHHPTLGLVSPVEFIGLAEQSAQINLISRWVIREAFRHLRIWQRQGVELRVSINLSSFDVADPLTLAELEVELAQGDIRGEQLVIEITEGSLIADMKRAQAFARQVKNYGVRLAIDDFGTGYSSLAQLRRLPVDELKIDQLFVRELCRGGQDDMIIRSTLSLAHQLGVAVVAEGIETQGVFKHLKALGCDMAQGYFISKPLEAAQVVHWLHAHQVEVRPLGQHRLPRQQLQRSDEA